MLIRIVALCMLLLSTQLTADEIKEVRIGALTALTGEAVLDNSYEFAGIKTAVAQWNAAGGVLGYPINLIPIDTLSTPLGSRVAAKKLIEENVVGVIGASWSSHSLAAAPVMQEAGIPMISYASTHPDLTEIGDYIFRVCASDAFQSMALAQLTYRELNVKEVVILEDVRSDYSMGLAEAFTNAYQALGGKILARLEYQGKSAEFLFMLQSAYRYAPQALFIPSHNEITTVSEDLDILQWEPILIGGDGWGAADFSSMRHGYYSTHWAPPSKDDQSELANQQRWFMEQHPQMIPSTVMAYDATNLLLQTIQDTGTLEPAKLRDALAATNDFMGLAGKVDFDQNGDNAAKGVYVMKVIDGEKAFFKQVYPLSK